VDQKEKIINQLDNDILQCKADIMRARGPEDADNSAEKTTQKPNFTKDNSTDEPVDIVIDESETDPEAAAVSYENVFDDLPEDDSPEDTDVAIFEDDNDSGKIGPKHDTAKLLESDADPVEISGLDETEGTVPDDSTRKTDREVPRFNLAEQILSEQRKIASIRRKKPNGNISANSTPEATGTVGQIIRRSKKPFTSAEGKEKIPEPVVIKKTSETIQSPSPAVHGTINKADNLSGSQYRIIADIVARDVAMFRRKTSSRQPVWQNYPDN
jgi:hypothetical protein